jgi:hypothetical protein
MIIIQKIENQWRDRGGCSGSTRPQRSPVGTISRLFLAAVDRAAGLIYAHFDFCFSRFRVIARRPGRIMREG